MSTNRQVTCDSCGKAVADDEKRMTCTVGEYEELQQIGGYCIPKFREIDLHWKCYEDTMMSTVRATDN